MAVEGWQVGDLDEWGREYESLCRDPEEMLDRILDHACGDVPYYASLQLAGVHQRPRLGQFPLLTKAKVSLLGDDLVAPESQGESRLILPTSGTSGVPQRVVRSAASVYQQIVDIVALSARDVGAAFDRSGLTGDLAVLVPALHGEHDVVLGRAEALGGRQIRAVGLEGTQVSKVSWIESLRASRPVVVLGWTRALLRLAHLDRQVPGGSLRVSVVAATGEPLYADQREALRDSYQVEPANVYGCQEFGMVATQCTRSRGLHVNPQWAVAEVLDKSGEIRPVGTGELVLTGLLNWAMPLIRFMPGDRATLERGRCDCGHVGSTITTLIGRDVARFTYQGHVVATSTLDELANELGCTGFQVAQDEHGTVVFMVEDGAKFPRQEEIQEALRQRIGHDIPVRVQASGLHIPPGRKFYRYLNSAEGDSPIYPESTVCG